jgi:diguanylate cyclase (GGDEF)-like protein
MKKGIKPASLVVPLLGGALAAAYAVLGFLGIFRAHPIAPGLRDRDPVFLGLAVLLYAWPARSFFRRGKEEWKLLPMLALLMATHLLSEQTRSGGFGLFSLYYLLALFVSLRLRWKPALGLYLMFLLLEFGATWNTRKLAADGVTLALHAVLIVLLGLVIFREKIRTRGLAGKLKVAQAMVGPLSSGPGKVDREEVAEASLADTNQAVAIANASLNQELDRLAQLIQRTFGCQTVSILLLDAAREQFVCRALRSFSGNVKPTVSLPSKQGILGWVLREGKDFLTEDYTQRAEALGYYAGEEIVRSVMIVPIMEDGRIDGVLAVDDKEPRAFDATRKEILKSFAELVQGLLRDHREKLQRGIAANQYRALNRLLEDLTSKLRVKDVLDSLMVNLALREGEAFVVRYDHLAVLLAQAGGAGYRVRGTAGSVEFPKLDVELSLANTLVGKVVEKRIAHYDPDLYRGDSPSPRFEEGEKTDHGLRSFLAVPLVAKNECLGVIVLESREESAYEEHDRGVVSILAKQAAMALRSAMFYEEKEALAVRDGLTGLANHRHFQEVLANELARSKRGGQPLTLAMLDLDHFKSVNDTFGHPKGDEVLVALARIMEGEVRSIDTVARYGGEEFALVLVQTDPAGALEATERIRARVAETKFPVDRQVTVSIGLAGYPADAETKDLLIAKADRALYSAKRERNKVCAAGDREGNGEEDKD